MKYIKGELLEFIGNYSYTSEGVNLKGEFSYIDSGDDIWITNHNGEGVFTTYEELCVCSKNVKKITIDQYEIY